MSFLRKIILASLMFGVFASITSAPFSIVSAQELNNEVQIFLEKETIVDFDQYKLSDIAHLEGIDPVLLEGLAKVAIGRSPLPGGSLVVTQGLIKAKLRPLLKSTRLIFSSVTKTIVRRSALRISGRDIDQAVIGHIHNEMEGLDIKLKLISKSRDVFLTKGELDFKVKSIGKYKKEGGYRTYEIIFSINKKVVKKVPLRVHIKIYKEVYVAKETIKRNQLIQDADLEKIRKTIDRLPSNYVTDKNTLVGKVAKRAINPNEVIQNNSIDDAPVVHSGDQILIVLETTNLRISTLGIALRKGKIGEQIPVRNLTSKNLVQAIVKNKNTVIVN